MWNFSSTFIMNLYTSKSLKLLPPNTNHWHSNKNMLTSLFYSFMNSEDSTIFHWTSKSYSGLATQCIHLVYFLLYIAGYLFQVKFCKQSKYCSVPQTKISTFITFTNWLKRSAMVTFLIQKCCIICKFWLHSFGFMHYMKECITAQVHYILS